MKILSSLASLTLLDLRRTLSVVTFISLIAWFWRSLHELYSLTQAEEHYSYIVLIPLLEAYLLHANRKAILASKQWSPAAGSILIGIGLAIKWYGALVYNGNDAVSVAMLGFVVCFWGAFVLLYGVGACRPAGFALSMLLFMVPLPSVALQAIVLFLQQSSTEVADVMFGLLGIPVYRQEFVFSLSNFTIRVAEECSGIRSFLSLLITTIVTGHLFLRSIWGRLGIVGIVVPLAILKNAFRIVGLGLLANYVDPTYVTNSVLHKSGGIPLFMMALVAMLSLVWVIRRCERRYGGYLPESLGVRHVCNS